MKEITIKFVPENNYYNNVSVSIDGHTINFPILGGITETLLEDELPSSGLNDVLTEAIRSYRIQTGHFKGQLELPLETKE